MKRVKLDRIDLRILQTLQQDGRMTNVELAKKAGISAPPCLRRVKALEDAGFIKSYHANLAADLLGYGVTIFTQVNLNSHHETDLNAFGALVQTWPMVRECYLVTGESSAFLKVVAESWESYQKFLTTTVMTAPRVTQTKSTLIIKTLKNEYGIPLAAEAPAKAKAGKRGE
ncbi:MAG: Lrp/AsnC family transcriptional regulator [Alphaproteobacteria bacterium]|nr:Lrp/AsnC family transcriptional regulator [Alphaproteobacteria bacterium]